MFSSLHIEKRILQTTQNSEHFQYAITNPTQQDIYIEDFEVFSADSLAALGLDAHSCMFLRTGRHKNDMPSAARFGRMDDAMRDALGGMTESGDRRSDSPLCRTIVSDHLTLLGDGDNWVVFAFTGGRDQLFRTEIDVDADGHFLHLRALTEFRVLIAPGQTFLTEPLRITRETDPAAAIERFAGEKAERFGARTGKIPSVFCTWYYYGLTVSWQDVEENLTRMQRLHLPFDVFQIDEGWEKTLGQWEPNEKFPLGMKEAAARIRQAGYTPGIWTSPFVASAFADVWQEHPEWMLRDKDGNPCIFPMNDTTYCVFDITHPGTWDYFEALYRKLTYDWGYTYHKLDFTRAAVIYENAAPHDRRITMARAYVEAVSAIRRGMGEEAYFLMCGGLYDPIIGLVDAQRTGSDVLSMWSSTINKGGKTAPYTIKQSLMRYYMNRWWHNDPDALMVRRNSVMERDLRLTYGLLSDDEVRTVVLNQFTGGGIVCSTEPLATIEEDRLHQLQHILPPLPVVTQPLDFLDGCRFPGAVRITIPGRSAAYLALMNWDDEKPLPVRITPQSLMRQAALPNGRYAVCEFFSGEYTLAAAEESVAFPAIAPHSAALIKVEPVGDAPIVVASDAHFAMGAEFTQLCARDGRLYYALPIRYDREAHYTVLVPGENGPAQTVSLHINSYHGQEGSIPLPADS
ncbi:MAG: alpha-galactosidase [Clostridia bacterium]|nr:alpha-galactosidase [Clostridia bacterium]